MGASLLSSLLGLCVEDLEPQSWIAAGQHDASAWTVHVPFVHWLVGATHPRVLVELGPADSFSYAVLCHAVEQQALSTRCFAMTSPEAGVGTGRAGHAPDRGSVDLLHLGGLPTDEAVRQSFETWLPKLSEPAVVLLDGIAEQYGNAGIRQFWSEVSARYPNFEFTHGQGLGVLAVGRAPPEGVSELCGLRDAAEIASVRHHASLLGERWAAQVRDLVLQRRVAEEASRIAALERQLEEQARQTRRLQARLDQQIQRAIAAERTASGSSVTEESLPWLASEERAQFHLLRSSKPRGRIAVVIHVYYEDLWPELSDAILNIKEPFDLFVTVAESCSEAFREKLAGTWPLAYILIVKNFGRDILPFLAIVRTQILFRYELICKLHTKRSHWHEDGESWRKDLIGGVLANRNLVQAILRAFRTRPDLGMIVADGHLYSGRVLWEGNRKHLMRLFVHFDMDESEFDKSFAGGSIFWVRSAPLRLVSDLPYQAEDFEPEPLGNDGCLVHAIERLFSLACYEAGMTVEETSAMLARESAKEVALG